MLSTKYIYQNISEKYIIFGFIFQDLYFFATYNIQPGESVNIYLKLLICRESQNLIWCGLAVAVRLVSSESKIDFP